MLKIGLTGGIGSGKSTVARFFHDLGAPVIDSDVLAREVLTHNPALLDAIVARFGETLLDAQRNLNRALLREIVFDRVEDRLWLENLLHPLIIEEIQKQVKAPKAPYCIIVIPLLIEATEPYTLVDRILLVDTPVENQIKRTQARDKIPPALIQKMLESQASREQRLKMADDVVKNDSDLENLKQQVRKLHDFYGGCFERSERGNP